MHKQDEKRFFKANSEHESKLAYIHFSPPESFVLHLDHRSPWIMLMKAKVTVKEWSLIVIRCRRESKPFLSVFIMHKN